MYVIAVYDVSEKRCTKMLKLCRQYLNWIQNFVFEGELNEADYFKLKTEANKILDKETDSFILFRNGSKKWLRKEIIGKEKSNLSSFL